TPSASVPDAGNDAGATHHDDAGAGQGTTETTEHELAGTDAEVLDSGLPWVTDSRGPREGPWRVVRGGNEGLAVAQWTSTRRRFRQPGDRRSWIGFRCVYDRGEEPHAYDR